MEEREHDKRWPVCPVAVVVMPASPLVVTETSQGSAPERRLLPNGAEGALEIAIKSGFFGFSDVLALRETSRLLKNTVDGYGPFQKKMREVFFASSVTFLRDVDGLYRVIIKKDKKALIEKYLKDFFVLMVSNVEVDPGITGRLVQISTGMGLKPEDFKELGEHVVTLFGFLAQPIVDRSVENEAKILRCVSGLMVSGYTSRKCKSLEISIRTTFALLRNSTYQIVSVYTNLAGANLENVYFDRANLAGASLRGVKFSGVHLEGGTLVGANLTGVNFANTSLYRAKLVGLDLRSVNFTKVTLTEAKLTRVNLAGSDLTRANFYGAYLDGANLTGANFAGVCLHSAELMGANLKGVILAGADLANTKLEGADFTGANLENADLRRASFAGANFEGVAFSGANFFEEECFYLFRHEIERSVESNPIGILPLLLAVTAESLDKIDSSDVVALKKLSRECLVRVLAGMDTVEALSKLFSQVSVKDNIFRYSPLLKKGVNDTYPDVLELIAKAYIARRQDDMDKEKDRVFREKLVQEIKKQKNFFSFQNAGWDALLNKINNAGEHDNLLPSRHQRMRPS